MEEAMGGRSKIRNRAVAEVFSRMELIEEWGTGIQRILKRAREYGLPTPEFLEIGGTFRVNLYRKTDKEPIKKADKEPIKKADKKPLYLQRQREVLSYIQVHGSISNKEARELLGLAESTTKRFLKQMADEGILKEQGEKKSRVYLKNI